MVGCVEKGRSGDGGRGDSGTWKIEYGETRGRGDVDNMNARGRDSHIKRGGMLIVNVK